MKSSQAWESCVCMTATICREHSESLDTTTNERIGRATFTQGSPCRRLRRNNRIATSKGAKSQSANPQARVSASTLRARRSLLTRLALSQSSILRRDSFSQNRTTCRRINMQERRRRRILMIRDEALKFLGNDAQYALGLESSFSALETRKHSRLAGSGSVWSRCTRSGTTAFGFTRR
jgi:hypothetical protein